MSSAAQGAHRHGIGFWASVVVGVTIAAIGARTYLDVYPDGSRRVALATWVIGSDIVHDALLVPATIAVGVLVHHFVPARYRPAVRFAGIASGTALLLAWRPLTHSGAGKHNSTLQPLDYTRATSTVVLTVLVVTMAWAAFAHRRRDPPTGPPT
jgi:hypothetical protein